MTTCQYIFFALEHAPCMLCLNDSYQRTAVCSQVSSQPGLGTFCTVFVPFASAVAHPGSVLWPLVKFPPFVHTPKITWLLWREQGRGTETSVEWNDLTHFVQSARQDALNETELTCVSRRFCGHCWFAVTEEFQSPVPTFYDHEEHRFSREGRRDVQEQGLWSL